MSSADKALRARASALGFKIRPAPAGLASVMREMGTAVDAAYSPKLIFFLPELSVDERRRHLHRVLFLMAAVPPDILASGGELCSPLVDTPEWARAEELASA